MKGGSAATMIVVREDLSIPGALEADALSNGGAAEYEARFFDLLRASRPDVVIVDLSRANGSGVDTILKIRQKSAIPILVVCDVNQPSSREYKLAGAAECLPAPVDLMLLNQTVQQIIRITRQVKPCDDRIADAISFAGLTFYPHQNLLESAKGASVKLTTSENLLLLHFVSQPWVLHSRAAVSEMLYGRHRPTSDRAIDIIVNRLRKKLASLSGAAGHNLIKTEFRRGYKLIADVATAPLAGSADGFAGAIG